MKFEKRSNAGRTSRPPREEDRLQEASPSLTVWFDGGCPLCRREILLIKKLDRRRAIHFEDVDRADAVCPLDRAELLSRFHAQELGHPVVSGAAAFVAMWRAIPLLRPFGELARLPPVLWALEFVYRRFLIIRPRLQKLVQQAGA
jgi:predicted DCC family thiol-disulfide oxidoreductase YuxK